MLACARTAGDRDLAIATDPCIGVDADDAIFHTVPQIESYHGAVGHRHAIDRERISVMFAGRGRRPGGWVGHTRSFAQQRMVQNRAVDHEFGDLRMTRPHARQCYVGLNAADCQAIGGLAVIRVLERDVRQPHIEPWPQADFGPARYRQPISGFAFDPGLDLRRQEAGRDPDDQQQCQDNDHGRDGGAGDFQCSHDDIPNRPTRHRFQAGHSGRDVFLKLIPERGNRSKELKIIRGCCKVM